MSKNAAQAAVNKSFRGRNYKCIFFDLDHTLWDYECNAREMLWDLHVSYSLHDKGVAFEDFHRRFKQINSELWELYDRGFINNEIIRTQRFKKVLEHFN